MLNGLYLHAGQKWSAVLCLIKSFMSMAMNTPPQPLSIATKDKEMNTPKLLFSVKVQTLIHFIVKTPTQFSQNVTTSPSSERQTDKQTCKETERQRGGRGSLGLFTSYRVDLLHGTTSWSSSQDHIGMKAVTFQRLLFVLCFALQ